MAITYSISGGADSAKFNIDGTTGKLTFKTAPDFENPGDANRDNVYEVQVKATDAGGAASTQDLRVTVKDISENLPPQITSAAAVSVNENQTAVVTVTATDPDDGGVTPPPSGEFDIPINFNDPMFTDMVTVSPGHFMTNNETLSHASIVGQQGGVVIFNVPMAKMTYCRIDSRQVASDGCIMSQMGGAQVYIDHCHFNNVSASNPGQTHVDGIQINRLTQTSTRNALCDIRNSYIAAGGNPYITAGMFVSDSYDGTIVIKDTVFESASNCPWGLRIAADSGCTINVQLENVYFVGTSGSPIYLQGTAYNNCPGTLNLQKFTNVCRATISNGVLVPGKQLTIGSNGVSVG